MELTSSVFLVLATLILPLCLGVFLSVKKKKVKPVLLGALTFTLFQLVLRLPLMQFVFPKMSWFTIMTTLNPVMTAFFFGFTAALFEEFGRYIIMNLFMKDRHCLLDGISFGVGHGGIEAILLVGINAVVTLLMASALVNPNDMIFAGTERISTMICHIAWSVMVLKGISTKKPIWLIVAFVLHWVIDTGVVLLLQAGTTTFAIEIIIAVFAVFMLGFIFYEIRLSKREKTL